ncbi:MAG: hypothetical protein HZA84_07160 [Thaumarchaeota archaeon]|nr:hypothetical protein [Nitrososphaerota archaeon]
MSKNESLLQLMRSLTKKFVIASLLDQKTNKGWSYSAVLEVLKQGQDKIKQNRNMKRVCLLSSNLGIAVATKNRSDNF